MPRILKKFKTEKAMQKYMNEQRNFVQANVKAMTAFTVRTYKDGSLVKIKEEIIVFEGRHEAWPLDRDINHTYTKKNESLFF